MINEEKLVSIIVPIYNVEKYLKKCLLSIQNQTHENIEVIMVNDGSPDKSKEICKEFLNDPRFKYIQKDNAGLASARNAGLEIVKGDYIACVDSDDWIEQNMIEILLSNLLNTNSDMSVCSYYIHRREKCDRKRICDNDNVNVINQNTALSYTILPSKFYGFSWNKLYKRELIGEQRYNESILKGEDSPFSIEYIFKCKKIVFQDLPLYNYRQDTISISRSRFNPGKMTVLESYGDIIKVLEKERVEEKIINLQKVQYANQLLSLLVSIDGSGDSSNVKYKNHIKNEMKEYSTIYLSSSDIDTKHKIAYLLGNKFHFLFKILVLISNI